MGVKGKIKRAIIVVILAVLAIVTIFPIWFLIVNSFKGQQEIVASPIALPKSWNLDYLKNAAEQINLGSSLLQTVLITVAAVALIVVISSFAAWAIARTDSKVANILFIAYTAAMLDGANIFQIYRYVVMPLLKPTTMTVVITNAVWIWNDYLLPFLVIGNNDKKTLTLSLYYAKSLSGQYGNPWELIFPAVLLCIIPIVIIFIILQKNIIEGISAGAVKG